MYKQINKELIDCLQLCNEMIKVIEEADDKEKDALINEFGEFIGIVSNSSDVLSETILNLKNKNKVSGIDKKNVEKSIRDIFLGVKNFYNLNH